MRVNLKLLSKFSQKKKKKNNQKTNKQTNNKNKQTNKNKTKENKKTLFIGSFCLFHETNAYGNMKSTLKTTTFSLVLQ